MTRALKDLDADRERRDRGVPYRAWCNAPAAPGSERKLDGTEEPDRDVCELGARPCPHLRCRHHVGQRGDGSFSCSLDFAKLPAEERTFERIAEVLGVTQERVVQLEQLACDKFDRVAPAELLQLLRIRRRHA